jgi:hypothetical protein
MKQSAQVIQLSSPTEESTVVKTAALFTFRALRTLGGYIAQIPVIAADAVEEVSAAWEESASPKQ